MSSDVANSETFLDNLPSASLHWHDAGAMALILLLQLAVFLCVWPADEFPILDDFDYAETSKALVEHQKLVLSDWPTATIVAHVVWGAGFIKLFGYSHFHLRWSTWTMSVLAAWIVYVWARRARINAQLAFFLAIAIFCNPIWIFYASTFMTDVPSAMWIALGLYFIQKRYNYIRNNYLLLWIGFLGGIAFLVRQTACVASLMLPFGEAIWRLTRQKRPAISTRTVFEDSLYIGAAMSLVIGGFYYWLYRVHGGVPYNFFSPPILNWLDPNVALERIAWTMLHCGLHVSPFAFIALRHRKLTGLSLTRKEITGIAIVALSLVAARICYGPTCAPTDSREFFDLGFGFDPWLRGRVTQLAGPSIPLYFTSLSLFDLATFSLAILGNLGIYLLLSDLYFAYRVSMRETDSTERRDDVPSQVRWGLDVFVLLLVVMANVGLFLVMANVYDRYMLPVELTSGILFARTYSRIRVPWQSWLLVCLLGIAGACFSQDYFCRHRAVWNAIADLHARGIPVAKINGGWEYTGVYRYNPQYRANGKLTGPYMRNLDPDLVAIHLAKFHPMILETPERIYNLTLTPLPGNDVVAEYPFRSWIHSGSIYVLKRRESK